MKFKISYKDAFNSNFLKISNNTWFQNDFYGFYFMLYGFRVLLTQYSITLFQMSLYNNFFRVPILFIIDGRGSETKT